jgi:hypothetical protein
MMWLRIWGWSHVGWCSVTEFKTKRGACSSTVVKALCYNPIGRKFETWWGKLQVFLPIYPILPASLDTGICSASNRNEYEKHKVFLRSKAAAGALRLTTSLPFVSRLFRQCVILLKTLYASTAYYRDNLTLLYSKLKVHQGRTLTIHTKHNQGMK